MSFSNPALNFLISMTTLFLFAALFVTTAQELIAQIFALRAKNLRNGIRQLLGAEDGSEELAAVLDHPLLRSLRPSAAWGTRDPSYIPSDMFATALTDALKLSASGMALIAATKEAAAKENASPLSKAIATLAQDANGDLDAFKANIARWFDAAMERASGVYKRRTQIYALALGLIAAASVNLDSVRIGGHLLRHPDEARLMADEAAKNLEAFQAYPETSAQRELFRQDLRRMIGSVNVPIGWGDGLPSKTGDRLLMLLGWFCTALAASLGASFWFDLLKRFVNIRASGPNPTENAQGRRLASVNRSPA